MSLQNRTVVNLGDLNIGDCFYDIHERMCMLVSLNAESSNTHPYITLCDGCLHRDIGEYKVRYCSIKFA